MRVTGFVLVLMLAFIGIAAAEKVKTNQEAKLFSHPGEQGTVLLHLKEGQVMTLLGEEGRWLKVRVQGRTGFIPRSKVDMPDKDEIARNTRRRPFVDGRSTKRGWTGGEGPDDRVGADALGETGTKASGGGGGGDDDDDDKKPAKKPATKAAAKGDDDDDDDAKKPVAKKPVAKAPAKGDDDDDDDAKKPAAKKPVAKAPAKAAAKSGDDDDDDDAKKPAAKKPVAKVAAKGDDDDDDAKKPAAKGTSDDKEVPDDLAAPKRRMVHITAKLKVYEERDAKSQVAFTANPDESLYYSDSKGDWTMIENDDGDAGWALSSSVEVDGGGGPDDRVRTIALDANLGMTLISQAMHTAGSTLTGANQVPDSYTIKASAATIAIGAGILVPAGHHWYLGGQGTYAGSKTVGGGIVYMSSDTGFTIHDINLRALAAYDFHRASGILLMAHLGFRYRAYLVDDYADAAKNTAKVPQETLKAPTLGVALAIPLLTPKLGLEVALDTILFGSSIAQTQGYEDGASPSMTDYELSAHIVYRWRPDFFFAGAYDFDYGSYNFGGPASESIRGHTGTDVTRTDMLHMLTVGVIKGF